jgi:hypothetical protein
VSEKPVTALLMDWGQGDRETGNELLVRMQSELRRIAAGVCGESARTTCCRRRR